MATLGRFPRRLTQLYSDTKISCDAVVEQDAPETEPEVNALHRKYRIQKDRLIAWGLEWSDNTKDKQGDIDESVERAGLTETVTSVLGTIKDILDEAERMQSSAAPAASTKGLSSEKSSARPPAGDMASWAAADHGRYEDLAKDLTTSIDTLYDLSRTRRSHREGSRGLSPGAKSVPEPPKALSQQSVFLSSEYNASDLTLVNPRTIPTLPSLQSTSFSSTLPPKLDPANLILPLEEPPPYESVGHSSSLRVIGRLKSTHSSTNPWKTDGSKTVETPVLVEYAAFDATYRFTEVSPPTDRLDSLLAIYGRLSTEQSFHGTLTCLGYFEDPKQPRFGLVFELPSFVYSGPSDSYKSLDELRPVTLLSVLQTGSKSLHNSNSATPPLEDRFRLAFTLARTFSKIHGDQYTHKDVNSSNIMVFRKNRRQSSNSRALQYALRSPVICSFDLFSDYDIEPAATMSSVNIYRHPEDPTFTGEKSRDYGPQFDLYGLGLILMEIGLWTPLSDLWKAKYTLADFKQRVEEVYIRRLASKCGTAYMQVVRDCFWAADRVLSGAESAQNISQLYNRILIRLQRCCVLDEADPSVDWADMGGSAFIPKRKNVAQEPTAAELPISPSSLRSPKRWIEKGSQMLERSLSNSKNSPRNSPNLGTSLSRNGSTRSRYPLRSSISHSLNNLMSPSHPPDRQDTPETTPSEQSSFLDESGTLIDSRTTTPTLAPSPTLQSSKEQGLVVYEKADAASVIQRAWRASRSESASFREYKEKIMVIQRHWRMRKQSRAIQALVTSSIPHWPQTSSNYPPREPQVRTIEAMDENASVINSSIQIYGITTAEKSKPKLRLHAVKFPPSIVDEWHTNMLPRLERLIERALKDSEETISIDLVAIGETQVTARPTIFITCTSTNKVKAVLARRFQYDDSTFDLKVRRGKVRRSKLNRPTRRRQPPHRSMKNTDTYNADMGVMNPFHQQRPLCGASIGAYRGEHLPPVSYGGVILVDDEPLGMSVHHLLDAPSEDDESEYGEEHNGPGPNEAFLSSANGAHNQWLMGMGSQPGVQGASDDPASMWSLEISDDEGMTSEDDDGSYDFSDSEFDSDEEGNDTLTASVMSHRTVGDIDGVAKGRGNSIIITQPAIDDVDDGFFPNDEDRDEDHLDSHELGHVHASSGIRRWNRDGVVHEIDWALLKLNPDRLQPYNVLQGGRKFCIDPTLELDQHLIRQKLEEPVCRRLYRAEEDEYPNQVAHADRLGGLRVHCFGRTSGLQGGIVGAAMSSVRIYRRKTFSRSWHVVGGFGVGGDSGAWVIQNQTHRVCGHVLAWCERNQLAYICPMEVLLEDIKRTLRAKRIYLPGSAEETLMHDSVPSRAIESTPKDVSFVGELEVGVEGLGIVDSAVDVTGAGRQQTRRSRPDLTPLVTAGESDKENLPVLRSRMAVRKDGHAHGGLEMVSNAVQVGGGRGRGGA